MLCHLKIWVPLHWLHQTCRYPNSVSWLFRKSKQWVMCHTQESSPWFPSIENKFVLACNHHRVSKQGLHLPLIPSPWYKSCNELQGSRPRPSECTVHQSDRSWGRQRCQKDHSARIFAGLQCKNGECPCKAPHCWTNWYLSKPIPGKALW